MLSKKNISLVVATSLASILGCSSITQKNMVASSPIDTDSGVIVGSVTAPPVWPWHETVIFHYRSTRGIEDRKGVFTSGSKFFNPLLKIPLCAEDGLERECGRLFAIPLPPGDYEIYMMNLGNSGDLKVPAAPFRVAKGNPTYLGNIDVTFCLGLPYRAQSAILGANMRIIDNYDRDISLIRARYEALHTAQFDKHLLEDKAWEWRHPFKYFQPYSWGECGSAYYKLSSPTHEAAQLDQPSIIL